jgi:NH3-dependent NAD+ synthetase
LVNIDKKQVKEYGGFMSKKDKKIKKNFLNQCPTADPMNAQLKATDEETYRSKYVEPLDKFDMHGFATPEDLADIYECTAVPLSLHDGLVLPTRHSIGK